MVAKDIFHNAVKRALKKDGWTITDDPFFLRFGGLEMYIDLGAEQLFADERGNEKIAVEVKSFIGSSAATEFDAALGQFLKYQLALETVGLTASFILLSPPTPIVTSSPWNFHDYWFNAIKST